MARQSIDIDVDIDFWTDRYKSGVTWLATEPRSATI
jgi:hypothetical protein